MTNIRKSTRLISLDALRGFTMFWIVGGAALISALVHFGQYDFIDFLIVLRIILFIANGICKSSIWSLMINKIENQ